MKKTSMLLVLIMMSITHAGAGSITYEPGEGPGAGKHIVFVCGEWEYRCEESLPMMARILARRHGFKCTVLFSMNPKDGTVDPSVTTNIPDMQLLKTSDMMVVFAMDLELPDEQIKHFVEFVESDKPVFGIRCTLLSFRYEKNKNSPYAHYDFRNQGGYALKLFGESWKGHYGDHAKESTRGLRSGLSEKSPLLKGVYDVWGPTDVYRVTQLPNDATVLMYGQVLTGMKPDDPPNLQKAVMPMVWIRQIKQASGKTRRVVTSTIGASQDMESEDLRRLYVNCIYWALGMESKIPDKADVNYVGGKYKATPFGRGTYKKGLKPSDYAVKEMGMLVPALQTSVASAQRQEFRRLPVEEYVDKMKAGWIGQMVGVGWGGPTEFDYRDTTMPEEEVPTWKPELVNQFWQDDLYVEMTFLRTLELYGLDVSIRQAGIDFANSGYGLAHANKFGRLNLRNGIAPPDSGHPKFNGHADDIDYQIEADYAGLISPGLPNSGIRLGETFGRLMNYGDGLYGGQFVSGLYAEAFFEQDMEKLVRAGLRCIPEGSQYHECISDVLRWWKENPVDWKKAWRLIEEKYHNNPDYRRGACDHEPWNNIDAKINGAYIVMGMLYGEGDLDQTIIISMRCGKDSDCNPSSAAGVLFTSLGLSKLPVRFTSALNEQGKFSHTPYSFPILVNVCETLARQAVLKAGGRVERKENGTEEFVIPVERPRPSDLEQCWEAGPIANSRFSAKELAQIVPPPVQIRVDPFIIADINEAVESFAPGWRAKHCWGDDDIPPGLHKLGLPGPTDWLVTHPLSEEVGCVLFKRIEVPAGKTHLRLSVGHHRLGDWVLVVKADGDELLRTTVGRETTVNHTRDIQVDLSQYAGSEILLELINEANGWSYEAAYWGKIAVVTE